MNETKGSKHDNDSIQLAMDQAWRDHHHTRDQTWKALQIEFLVVAGLVGADWQLQSSLVTIVAAILVCIVTVSGIQITLRHRNSVEVRKFEHIMNCEEALGLHTDSLICGVKPPSPISILDAFNPRKGNTALFILRMHLAIMAAALFVLLFKLACWCGVPSPK